VLALLAFLIVVLVRSGDDTPRARPYRDVTACLLTDAHGVTGAEAAPVWAGMQEASLATLAKVQFLEVDGPETVDNARTYLGSLVLSRCDLVIAVGAAQVGAVKADAGSYPDVRFVVVGGDATAGNIVRVDAGPAAQVSAAVSRIVADAVG
jgi:basic membrane lipoprotein Med (substrate-binding protein (PBP1-ABC) superfamily)